MKKVNPILIGASLFLFCANISFAKNFTDVSYENPFHTAIRYLSSKGIINGYQDNTFRAEQNITRSELLKILFESNKTKTPTPKTNCFPDVGYKEWYSKYICTAKDMKIINGYKDGKFKPDQNVKKTEALKIIGEFYKWKTLEKNSKNDQWYSKYLEFATDKNLLAGYATKLSILDPITRGDLSSIIYRFLAKEEYKADKFSAEIDNKIAMKIAAEDTSSKTTEAKDSSIISRNLPEPQIVNLAPGEIKIILSWEEQTIPPETGLQEKTQFNSYLLQPTNEEISFKHKIDSKLDTILETKGTTETFTIRKIKSAVKTEDGKKDYLYFAESTNGQTTFFDAKMKVEIYDKNGLVKTILAYQDTSRIWKLFTLNENYELRIFNSIGECSLIRDSERCTRVPATIEGI